MAKKIRKQTLALKSYLDKVKEEDISDSQDVQRKFCWDNNAINELIVTVLTDDYIPPIILGEEELGDGLTQQYIVDGMQRTSSLILFRYGNYKITSAIEDSIIEYQIKKRDEKGNICKDDDGTVNWESKKFDIKKKSFSDLPHELQKKFDDYQIEIAVHQNCTMKMISKLVRRYNNHKPMNNVQKAFTFMEKYARKIRNIVDLRFFKECGNYPEAEKPKGTYERIVMESVMVMFHLNEWKKTPKDIGKYLNKNSSDEEFDTLKEVLKRLETIVDDKFTCVFTIKDSFIWFTLFYRFTKLGENDIRFVEFLEVFNRELCTRTFTEYDNKSFYTIDDGKGTKDKKIIIQKLDMLERLMKEYLHIKIEGKQMKQVDSNMDRPVSVIDFVRENVKTDVNEEDINLYEAILDDYIEIGSDIRDEENEPSIIALIAHSVEQDIDLELEDWFPDFIKQNTTYIKNQKENYIFMRNHLDKFVDVKQRKLAG